jgi:hypothetical protein
MLYDTPTPAELAAYMRMSDSEIPEDDLQGAIDLAAHLLDLRLEQAWRTMPQVTYTQIVLDGAHLIYKRRNSLAGNTQFAFDNGSPVFDPKDVFNRSWPILRQYVTPFPLPRDEASA